MYILAVDLNAKQPVWNSKVSNSYRPEILGIVSSNFEISIPHCPTHYTPYGKGDVLDSVVHQNVHLSRALSLTSSTQKLSNCLLFWIMFGRGKFQIKLKNSQAGFSNSRPNSPLKHKKCLENSGKKPGIQNAKWQYTNMLWLHNIVNTLATT
jgi:hypothetical protein